VLIETTKIFVRNFSWTHMRPVRRRLGAPLIAINQLVNIYSMAVAQHALTQRS